MIHPADREIDELATQPSFRRRRAGRRLCFFLHRYFRGAGIGVAHGFGARPAVASAREIAPELLYGMKIQLFRRMHGARGMALAVGDRRDSCVGEEQIAMKRQHGPARLHRL